MITSLRTNNCRGKPPAIHIFYKKKLCRNNQLHIWSFAFQYLKNRCFRAIVDVINWSSFPEVLYKKGFVQNFTKFTGKHLNLYLIKETPVQVFSGAFCGVLKNTHFCRTSVNNYFCINWKNLIFLKKIVANLHSSKLV